MTDKRKTTFRTMLVALLAVPCTALAQNWYVGATAGESKAREWCSSTAPGVVLTACDDKDTAGKAYAGYWLTPFISLEVDYIDWGRITATANGTNFGGSNRSWGFVTLAALPIGDFQFFGKLGVLQTETKATGGGKNTESHYGAGALYNVSKSVAFRAEWERAEANALELMSIGLQIRF